MSTTKKKAKKRSSIKSEITRKYQWPWSELPPSITQSPSIEKYFHPIYSQGITKSWLTTSSRCKSTHQWRRLHHLANNASSTNSSVMEPYNRYYNDDSCIDAWTKGLNNTSYWCVLKPNPTGGPNPPPSMPPCSGANLCHPLFSNPKHYIFAYVQNLVGNIPTSTLMVHSEIRCERYCYYYKRIKYECVSIDPFDAKKKYMEFTSVVQCEGKVYAMSLQGTLVVMEIVDMRLRITDMSTSRAVPNVSSRFFKEYLMELKGEIVLVFLIHQKSLEIVDQIEVFRLCFVKLEWIKVERLDGKTLFLGQSCNWGNSAEIGCRDDCVYFAQDSKNEWWMYDLGSGCILHV